MAVTPRADVDAAPQAARPPVGARLFALTAVELRMGLRSAAFRLVAVGAFLAGWSLGAVPGGRGVAISAYATGEAAWQYLGLVAILWMALAAVRDAALRTETLIYSKPQPNERLSLARFLGSFLPLLAILLAMFAGALLGRWWAAGFGALSGFSAYVLQYGRAAGVLFVASSASYCLALLFGTPLAGALIAMYWVVALAGKSFLAKAYFPGYTQNLLAYLFLGIFLLGCALWLHRRARRGGRPAALWVRLLPLASLLLGGWAFWTTLRNSHDPPAHVHPALELMAEQNITVGNRTPGFRLPDQYGKPTSLSDFPGSILVVALWSPQDRESVLLLARLDDLRAKYGARGVQPVAICLSEDTGAGVTFARGESLAYPVVSDWGSYHAPRSSAISPLADAYQAHLLPRVVVTDRRRRARRILEGTQAFDGPDLEQEVRQRLVEEPK